MSQPPSGPRAAASSARVFETPGGGARILCLADTRGEFKLLNELAKQHNVDAIIHTGDIGFIDNSSIERISDKVLRHLITYSPTFPPSLRSSLLSPNTPVSTLRSTITSHPTPLLSTLPLLVSGDLKLDVPVYAVAGACEDVQVLEKLRTREYSVPNLHILDEATTSLLQVGGIKLRLFGLGGALVLHKLFDNGEGTATIAGGQGTTWITALQLGELVDTAQRVYDTTETRLLVTHASPGREGLLAQLALVLKADITISASLHFRMSSSYNDFSVFPSYEVFMSKLIAGRTAVHEVYETVKEQVERVLDGNQRVLLSNFLTVTNRVPGPSAGKTGGGNDEAWKHCWHLNLADAAVGSIVLDVKDGKIGSEIKSQGFSYMHRLASSPSTTVNTPVAPPTGPQAGRPLQAAPAASASAPAKQPPSAPSKPAPSGPSKPTTPTASFKPPTPTGPSARSKTPVDKQQQQQNGKADAQPPQAETTKTPTPAPTPAPAAAPSASADANKKGAARDYDDASAATSPTSAAAPSAGRKTPTSKAKPERTPWTLFVRGLVPPVSEADVREFFGGESAGITSVKLVYDHKTGAQRNLCYVEFTGEAEMREGEKKNGEKLKNASLQVVQADQDKQGGGGGGRGRGRGGFRGGGTLGRDAAASLKAASSQGQGSGESG